jgi:hypothetical protein
MKPFRKRRKKSSAFNKKAKHKLSLQKYLLSCSAFDPWSLDKKNLFYIVLMISVAWFIPLVTITDAI